MKSELRRLHTDQSSVNGQSYNSFSASPKNCKTDLIHVKRCLFRPLKGALMVWAAGFAQWQPVALNHVPDSFLVNGIVAVDQAIAETDDALRVRKLHKRFYVSFAQPD